MQNNKDIFLYISECIDKLYEHCKEAGIWLKIVKIEPAIDCPEDIEEDYKDVQLIWSCAETYEIMECLRKDSMYYRGRPITKNDIMDFIIDWELEQVKAVKKVKKKK